jgi:hypothetical protein
MTDGTSNQLLFGEHHGGWSDTNNDGFFDVKEYEFGWFGVNGFPTMFGLPKGSRESWRVFQGPHEGILQFALADGSVRNLSLNMNENIYFALSGMADGKVIGDF